MNQTSAPSSNSDKVNSCQEVELAINSLNKDETTVLSQHQPQIPIVFFGRLEERKGLCIFIKAIQALNPQLKSNVKIIFMGKIVPLYSAELRHLDSQQYITRELNGHIYYEIISNLYSAQAIEYIRSLDHPIICLTSPQENFPNSALEMGQLPVSLVVSDTGGFRETLQLVNRQSGIYWFKPKDSDSLSEILTQALQNYPETPSVSKRSTLEQVNKSLLTQKLEYIEQAFNQANLPENSLPKLTIVVNYHNQGRLLLDCLCRLQLQTYKNVEVIVVDDGSNKPYSQDLFEQYKFLFPEYKFIRFNNTKGLGATFNYLIDLSTGDYLLTLDSHILLLPFALEKFAEAARYSRATIITSSSYEVGEIEQIRTFSEAPLPMLLKSNLYAQACLLFAIPFLKKFRHIEDKDIQDPTWAIIAAALVTGEKIVSYPYPLYEYKITRETLISQQPHPREQYYLRQYLAQIPPSDWSPRQIYMLLTTIQQLQSQSQSSLNSSTEVDELRALLKSLQSEHQALQAEVERLSNEAAQAKERVAQALQAEVERLSNEAAQAKERVAAMETSKFWTLRKAWFSIKRRVGLPINE